MRDCLAKFTAKTTSSIDQLDLANSDKPPIVYSWGLESANSILDVFLPDQRAELIADIIEQLDFNLREFGKPQSLVSQLFAVCQSFFASYRRSEKDLARDEASLFAFKRKIDQTIEDLKVDEQRLFESLKRKELAVNLVNFQEILTIQNK